MGNQDKTAQTAQSALPTDETISGALDQMWGRHRSLILERVAVLEAAASAVIAKTLTESGREAAQAAAHKLAGTLGMFNLARGTDLARELDLAYSSESALATASGAHLATLAAELRTMIENRGAGTESRQSEIESRKAGTESPVSGS
jgi:HPt (histidine-containing phosphotransfer) domain-containing protein